METKLGQVELLSVSERVMDKYRKFIRNNENEFDELMIQKKLFRNFLLGEEQWREDNIVCRCFGKLEILADIDGMRILNIHNKISSRKFHYIDFTYKERLNELLEIM